MAAYVEAGHAGRTIEAEALIRRRLSEIAAKARTNVMWQTPIQRLLRQATSWV
jgi:hypothetical protein